jgi:hypothetical protein
MEVMVIYLMTLDLAVPIIGYHNIDNNKTRDSTDVSLFAREMKYIYDNGLRVLTVNDLGYDTNNNFLYIKPSITELTNHRHAVDAIQIIL